MTRAPFVRWALIATFIVIYWFAFWKFKLPGGLIWVAWIAIILAMVDIDQETRRGEK